MRKRRTYTGDFKAKVILEYLGNKKGLTELADQYELHPNQIKNWKSLFLKQAAHIFDDKRRSGKSEK
jgi:transposase-like protein